MDVAHPIRSVVPTLDGPILEVLARTTQPLTGREVHRLAGIGSQTGIRLALTRLVHQGLVISDERSQAIFYQANRNHIAWPVVLELTGLRRSLVERLRGLIGSWTVPPVHASLLGSAARADGDAGSDIDILLVRPTSAAEDEPPWAEQVDTLRSGVQSWTGNHCQVFQLDLPRLREHVDSQDPLVDEWRRDAIRITGDDLRVVLRGLPPRRGRK